MGSPRTEPWGTPITTLFRFIVETFICQKFITLTIQKKLYNLKIQDNSSHVDIISGSPRVSSPYFSLQLPTITPTPIVERVHFLVANKERLGKNMKSSRECEQLSSRKIAANFLAVDCLIFHYSIIDWSSLEPGSDLRCACQLRTIMWEWIEKYLFDRLYVIV